MVGEEQGEEHKENRDSFELKSSDVPQANSLDRLRQFVGAVQRGATQKREIQSVTGLSPRHADYYGQAARILGWVEREGEVYSLQHGAAAILETKVGSEEEREAFARAIEACEVIRHLAPELLQDPGPSEDDLTSRIRSSTDLAQKTARRRAQALLTWRARIVHTQEEPDQDLVPLLIDDEEEGKFSQHSRPFVRIDGLRVEKFKGLRQAELELTGLTIFAGPHGVGKSSLRDLFRFLQGLGRGYSLPEVAGERWGETGTLEWSGIRGGPRELPYLGQDTFSLSLNMAVPDGSQLRPTEYAIEVRISENGSPRVVRERLSVEGRGTFVFDSHPEADPPLQLPDRLAVRLGRASRTRGPTLLVDPRRPALSQIALHPAVRTRSVTDTASWVLAAFRSLRLLEPTTQAMRRPSFPDQLALGDRGENLSSVLLAIANRKDQREPLIQSLRGFTDGLVSDIDFLTDAMGRVLLAVVDRSGAKLSAHSVSEGVLRFMALQAALLGPESPGFWFLDNLDTGFSPAKLGLLLELFEHHATATPRQIVVTLRDEDVLETLDLTSDGITSAYQMFPYGWRAPERLGMDKGDPTPRPPQRARSGEDDDPNERLPF